MMFGSFARMWRLRDTDSPERYGLLLPVLAVCSLLPLLSGFRYGFDGVDVNYHFDSWIDMVRCWRSGVLLPGWAQQANYGLGDPLPIWGVSKFRAQNMKLKGFKMPTEEQVTIERQSADTRMSDRMKILYVAPLKPGNTSLYRQEALNRLGHTTISFATDSYEPRSRVMNKLRYRWPVGRLISRVNRELLTAVQAERPSIVWFDKPTAFTPETIKAVKSMGAKTVCYNQDNPFGPREDGCWLQFKRVYQLFDLHCLFRTVDDKRYRRWGLPAIKIALSHDSQQHFPPPAPWSDEQRIREVSYTGSPLEDRADFLRKLGYEYGVSVSMAGPRWEQALSLVDQSMFLDGGMMKGKEYRQRIWRSKINLAFITKKNEEDVAHKAFEITACGQFLLAERSEGHLEAFQEGKEAEFFSSVAECAEKCRYYLAHPEEREAIAAAGLARSRRSGYDNDSQLAKVLSMLG